MVRCRRDPEAVAGHERSGVAAEARVEGRLVVLEDLVDAQLIDQAAVSFIPIELFFVA